MKAIGIAAFFIAGTALAGALNASLEQRTREAVGHELKDASSARYRLLAPNMWLAKDGDYCGCVNARNSFGGYSGLYPFFIQFPKDGSRPRLVLIDSARDDLASRMCRQMDYRPDC